MAQQVQLNPDAEADLSAFGTEAMNYTHLGDYLALSRISDALKNGKGMTPAQHDHMVTELNDPAKRAAFISAAREKMKANYDSNGDLIKRLDQNPGQIFALMGAQSSAPQAPKIAAGAAPSSSLMEYIIPSAKADEIGPDMVIAQTAPPTPSAGTPPPATAAAANTSPATTSATTQAPAPASSTPAPGPDDEQKEKLVRSIVADADTFFKDPATKTLLERAKTDTDLANGWKALTGVDPNEVGDTESLMKKVMAMSVEEMQATDNKLKLANSQVGKWGFGILVQHPALASMAGSIYSAGNQFNSAFDEMNKLFSGGLGSFKMENLQNCLNGLMKVIEPLLQKCMSAFSMGGNVFSGGSGLVNSFMGIVGDVTGQRPPQVTQTTADGAPVGPAAPSQPPRGPNTPGGGYGMQPSTVTS